jgi:hypothetical protein
MEATAYLLSYDQSAISTLVDVLRRYSIAGFCCGLVVIRYYALLRICSPVISGDPVGLRQHTLSWS